MDENTLKSITDQEMRAAVGWYSGKLAAQRQKAMAYYLAKPTLDLTPPEIEGRSSVVSPDVRNTIESMLPQLMVKFSGSDRVVEFSPQKPGDEKKAEQATDYINHILHVKNPGERVVYNWIKDALLSKNGIVKVWWDDRKETKSEEYNGLSDVELAQLLDDDEVEITAQKSYPDEEDAEKRADAIQQLMAQGTPEAAQQIAQIQAMPPVMVYDVVCIRSKKCGQVRVENVPPEEFLISRKAKDIENASFVGHRVARTLSELRSMGYKNVDQISGDDQATALNFERIERLGYDDELAYLQADTLSTPDDSQRMVWLTECYVRVDYDGDGISELRKVVRAGNQILENEVCDVAPFVSITPVPMPHKFFGLSIADLAMEGQKINTALLRGVLDNTYLQINGRYFAVDGQVNLDDLLASRPGGVVRIKQPGAAGRLDQGAGDSQLGMGMLEYMKGFQEDSTGWTRYNQGTDGDSLNQTATGVNLVTNRADMRLDLIARNFAQGFRDLFRMMLKLVCQYEQREQIIKLRGEWFPVNPREWINGFDCEVNVGLGTGNKDQTIAHMMALLQQQTFGLQVGTATPENVYQAQQELTKAMGFKSADKFFSDPAKMPPKPPPPHPDMIKAQSAMQLKQMELQADAQKFQAQMQIQMQAEERQHAAKMAEMQASLDVQRSNDERDAMREQARIQLEAQAAEADRAHKERMAEMQAAVDKYRADLDAQIAQYKTDQDNQTKLIIAGQQAQQAQQSEQMRMQHEAAQKGEDRALSAAQMAQKTEKPEKPEKPAPEPAAVEVDVTPIAEAVEKLAEIHKSTIDSLGAVQKAMTARRVLKRAPDGTAYSETESDE